MKIFGHKPVVNIKQLLFICYAGLIRGAIAFGLVLRLDDFLPNTVEGKQKLGIFKTTALTLVVSTTLIFGSTMAPVQKFLLPKLTDEQKME